MKTSWLWSPAWPRCVKYICNELIF
jgi:hypothetical protein